MERKLIPFVKDDDFRDLVQYLRDLQLLTEKVNTKAREVIMMEDKDFDNPTLGYVIGLDKEDW